MLHRDTYKYMWTNDQNGGIQDGGYFQDGDQLNKKNKDILMIIKTMLSAVIDTLCLTVIHLRIDLIKYISDKKLCNPKWPLFLASIGSDCLLADFCIFNQL